MVPKARLLIRNTVTHFMIMQSYFSKVLPSSCSSSGAVAGEDVSGGAPKKFSLSRKRKSQCIYDQAEKCPHNSTASTALQTPIICTEAKITPNEEELPDEAPTAKKNAEEIPLKMALKGKDERGDDLDDHQNKANEEEKICFKSDEFLRSESNSMMAKLFNSGKSSDNPKIEKTKTIIDEILNQTLHSTALESENEKMKQKINELQDELAKQLRDLETANKEKEELKDMNAKYQTSLGEAHCYNVTLTQKLNLANATIRKMSEENEELKQLNAQHQMSLDDAHCKNATLTQQLDSASKKVQELVRLNSEQVRTLSKIADDAKISLLQHPASVGVQTLQSRNNTNLQLLSGESHTENTSMPEAQEKVQSQIETLDSDQLEKETTLSISGASALDTTAASLPTDSLEGNGKTVEMVNSEEASATDFSNVLENGNDYIMKDADDGEGQPDQHDMAKTTFEDSHGGEGGNFDDGHSLSTDSPGVTKMVSEVQVNPCEIMDKRKQNEDVCYVCDEGGSLICCDFCDKSFHLRCHKPRLHELPSDDEWKCCECLAAEMGEKQPCGDCVECIIASCGKCSGCIAKKICIHKKCKNMRLAPPETHVLDLAKVSSGSRVLVQWSHSLYRATVWKRRKRGRKDEFLIHYDNHKPKSTYWISSRKIRKHLEDEDEQANKEDKFQHRRKI